MEIEQLHDESILRTLKSQGVSEVWNENAFDEVLDDEQLHDETNVQKLDLHRILNGRMNNNESDEVIDEEHLQDETNPQEFCLSRISVVHSAEEIETYMNETHMIRDMLPEESPHQTEAINHQLYDQTVDRNCGKSTRRGLTTSISNTKGGSSMSIRGKSVRTRGGSIRGKSLKSRGGSAPSMRQKSLNSRGGSTMSLHQKFVNSRGALTTTIREEERQSDDFDTIPEVIPDIQRERLVQLVHNNFLKTVGQYSGADGVKLKRQLWDKYTRELNSLGPPRTALQWENCLNYIRGTARRKLAENRRNENEFGRGKKNLSRLEEKVVSTWGLNNLDGEQQLGEGGFQYEKTIIDRSKSWTASKTRDEGGSLGLIRSECTQISNSTITASLSRPRPISKDTDPRAGHIVSTCNLCASPNLHSHCEQCNNYFCRACDMLFHKHPNRIDHSRTTIFDRNQDLRKSATSGKNIINDSGDNVDRSEVTEITNSPIRGAGSMEESRSLNVSNQQAHGINLNRVEIENMQIVESSGENTTNMTGDHPELIGESNLITSEPLNNFEFLDIESERLPRSAPANVRSSAANVTRSNNRSSRSSVPTFHQLETALPFRNARHNDNVQDQSARNRRDRSRERNVSKNRLKYYLKFYQAKIRNCGGR